MKKILVSMVSVLFVVGALTSCEHGGTHAHGDKGCTDCAGASKEGKGCADCGADGKQAKSHGCPDCKTK
jgi:hypothetical protein